HLSSSSPVQSEASLAQRRSPFLPADHASRAELTCFENSGGNESVCRFIEAVITRLGSHGAETERAVTRLRRVSVKGARATPRSVMIAAIISFGVTSKAKLLTETPSGASW